MAVDEGEVGAGDVMVVDEEAGGAVVELAVAALFAGAQAPATRAMQAPSTGGVKRRTGPDMGRRVASGCDATNGARTAERATTTKAVVRGCRF